MDQELFDEYLGFARMASRAKMPDNPQQLKSVFASAYHRWKSDPDQPAPDINLAWAAVGLMMHGEVSVIPDAIGNIPPHSQDYKGSAYRLLGDVVVKLLPLHGNLKDNWYVRTHQTELLEWFYQHQDQLIWDAEQRQFMIRKLGQEI